MIQNNTIDDWLFCICDPRHVLEEMGILEYNKTDEWCLLKVQHKDLKKVFTYQPRISCPFCGKVLPTYDVQV